MLLLLQQNLGFAWGPAVQVVVPDVVGLSQAAGTSALEAEGFVVSVSADFSDTVPVGDIISQNPAAGIEAAEGSVVAIVVSLGAAPVGQGSEKIVIFNRRRGR
jgi:beta-lactam-binding protein with PASTA domain